MDDIDALDAGFAQAAFGISPTAGYDPMAKIRASGLRPEFYLKAVENKAKTAEAGTPIYDQAEYCRILQVGQQGSVNDVPVKHLAPWQKELFKPVYDHWKATREHKPISGTPLETVPWLDVAAVATYKAANIHILQDLAVLDDAAISRLGPGTRTHVRDAKRQVEAGKDQALVNRMAANEEKMKAELEQMRKDNADLKAKLDMLIEQRSLEVPANLKRRA